jgi:hypothetical protein
MISGLRYWLSAVVLLSVFGSAQEASATNWLMLQGTEPKDAPAIRPFGFVGIDYQYTGGTDLPAGPWQGQSMVLNRIAPKLEDSETFKVSHLRFWHCAVGCSTVS